MSRIICLSEDAYKKIVNPATGDLFSSRGFYQVPKMTDEKIIKAMAGYKIDREDKKVRMISPILNERGVVVDIAVAIEVTNTEVIWDRK